MFEIHTRPRRTGRRDGGGDAVGRRLPGRTARAGFPSFGSERTGAPVVAFCRISDREIRLQEPILEPDCLIVQDPTLFKGRSTCSPA